MAVRLKDIAEDLGVSVVTVSKVLRNHSDISLATKQRVWKRMQELNYRPNLAARALVTGRSFAVGLVVPDLTHTFFSQVAKGISQALRREAYSLVIACSEEDASLEQQEIEQLLARQVDALIVASTQRTADYFRSLDEREITYVLIDRKFPDLTANFVGMDDVEVGRMATRHLIESGYRRIAHISGPNRSTAYGRMHGYQMEMESHGLPVLEGYITAGKTSDDAGDASGYEAMQRLLRLERRPEAVFSFNDPTCLGAMRAVFDAGLQIPKDVAMIGCGNLSYMDLLRVPLSTIDQASLSMGEHSARLALDLIESRTKLKPKTILVQPQLIQRASTSRNDFQAH
ncbi:MAG: LacI family DNA-binding transcriptional regulator [Acidobacteriia bacterium]|nr:LacI family DNA-binding transcriptional regulator [Terriglobia bacterium]